MILLPLLLSCRGSTPYQIIVSSVCLCGHVSHHVTPGLVCTVTYSSKERQCVHIERMISTETRQDKAQGLYLSRELETDLVAAMAMAHEVFAQLPVGEHDITEVEGSCSIICSQHSII